jgi:predicted nucleic acid-binding protein
MVTAVDTNIILDVLIPGEPFGEPSKELLDRHLSQGKLIVCEVVVAELAAWFASGSELTSFLADTRISLVHSREESLHVAGSRWARYAKTNAKGRFACGQCGHVFVPACPECGAALTKRRHVLADFLIGAHAVVQADCILSRDLGVYRTYFRDLKVVDAV